MFNLLFYFNIILISTKLIYGKTFERTHSNESSLEEEAPWSNLWFPHPPNYEKNELEPKVDKVASTKETSVDLSEKNRTSEWTGLWFPNPPNYKSDNVASTAESDLDLFGNRTSDWPGLFFPYPPNYKNKVDNDARQKHACDNGKDDISVDFDPEDKRHSFNYLCFGNKSEYAPNFDTYPLLKEYVIPAAYEPPVKCLYDSIEYSTSVPTFGAFRPLAPKFGSYKYLPPQRWLHSLADGAIVLLYHPCAYPSQIIRLQNTLTGCLYRHVITPSQHLTPQYPLALLAWGKILKMSVVDEAIVVKFIKDNAKMGFKPKQRKLETSQISYDACLIKEAHLVTDEQDKEICGYTEMR